LANAERGMAIHEAVEPQNLLFGYRWSILFCKTEHEAATEQKCAAQTQSNNTLMRRPTFLARTKKKS
jgi:hypothetical protein